MSIINNIQLEGVVVNVPDELNDPQTAINPKDLKIILMTYGQAAPNTPPYQYFAIQFRKSLSDIVKASKSLSKKLKGNQDAELMKDLLNKRLVLKNAQLDSDTIRFLNKNGDTILTKPVVVVYADTFDISGMIYPPESEELTHAFSNWGQGGGGYKIP